jgi:hypothetical protein
MNHLNNVLYQQLIQGLVLNYIISFGHFDRGTTSAIRAVLGCRTQPIGHRRP